MNERKKAFVRDNEKLSNKGLNTHTLTLICIYAWHEIVPDQQFVAFTNSAGFPLGLSVC